MGHLHIDRSFSSPLEGFARTIRIYTPDAYELEPDRRFPVLYLHDGQNVFAHPDSARYETWCANSVLEQLAGEGRMEPWILVGIDSGPGRMSEYSPFDEPRVNVEGRGDVYARFIVETLKPYVDHAYRTRPGAEWTATMGSSMGGLISLWLGLKYPHVFGRIGALSPTVMWGHRQLFRHFRTHPRSWTRIYLDAGAHEQIQVDNITLDYGEATRDFYFHLRSLGYGDHEVFLVLEPGGEHDEKAWQRRLPLAFRWLMG